MADLTRDAPLPQIPTLWEGQLLFAAKFTTHPPAGSCYNAPHGWQWPGDGSA